MIEINWFGDEEIKRAKDYERGGTIQVSGYFCREYQWFCAYDLKSSGYHHLPSTPLIVSCKSLNFLLKSVSSILLVIIYFLCFNWSKTHVAVISFNLSCCLILFLLLKLGSNYINDPLRPYSPIEPDQFILEFYTFLYFPYKVENGRHFCFHCIYSVTYQDHPRICFRAHGCLFPDSSSPNFSFFLDSLTINC